jgi:hypothetical protein
MLLGTTYSHKQISWLSLTHEHAFRELLSLKLDVIRLCCYWSDIEKKQGVFDLAFMHEMLHQCDRAGQNVVVTIGMKAPRWPEYFIPSWVKSEHTEEIALFVHPFIQKTIKTLKSYKNILAWQVENEPLDLSGPKEKRITPEVLKTEVTLVKQIDPTRPVLVTLRNRSRRDSNRKTILDYRAAS